MNHAENILEIGEVLDDGAVPNFSEEIWHKECRNWSCSDVWALLNHYKALACFHFTVWVAVLGLLMLALEARTIALQSEVASFRSDLAGLRFDVNLLDEENLLETVKDLEDRIANANEAVVNIRADNTEVQLETSRMKAEVAAFNTAESEPILCSGQELTTSNSDETVFSTPNELFEFKLQADNNIVLYHRCEVSGEVIRWESDTIGDRTVKMRLVPTSTTGKRKLQIVYADNNKLKTEFDVNGNCLFLTNDGYLQGGMGRAIPERECNTLRLVKSISPEVDVLNLCEIELLDENDEPIQLYNASARGIINTLFGNGIDRAIDGNTGGNLFADHCVEITEQNDENVEFSVRYRSVLNQVQTPKKIVIYNRLDCCQQRLEGVKVFLGEREVGTIEQVFPNQAKYEILLNN